MTEKDRKKKPEQSPRDKIKGDHRPQSTARLRYLAEGKLDKRKGS